MSLFPEEMEPRGWAMRYGHRKRLSRPDTREGNRGRATYARRVNQKPRRCYSVDRVPQRKRFSKEELCPEPEEEEFVPGRYRRRCKQKAKETAWSRGNAVAEEGRREYTRHIGIMQRWAAMVRVWQAGERAVRQAKAKALAGEMPERPPRPKPEPLSKFPKVQVLHGPTCPKEHAAALKELGGEGLVSVKEWQAVEGYLKATVGRMVEVHSVQRVLDEAQRRACHGPGGFGRATLMWHGCRSAANEAGILEKGFQTSLCCSGGQGFGTWFAYGAAYSDGAFAYVDSDRRRHLFLCMVSDRWAVMDSPVMRVVAQGCAYPVWLLTYSLKATAPPPPAPAKAPPKASPVGLAKAPPKASPVGLNSRQLARGLSMAPRRRPCGEPGAFFVAQGGKWVARPVCRD